MCLQILYWNEITSKGSSYLSLKYLIVLILYKIFKLNLLEFRYTLMRNCWKVNPDERPSFEEIHNTLNHILTDDEVINIVHYYYY